MKNKFIKFLVIILVGLLLGTALGSILSKIIPSGWLKQIFLSTVNVGFNTVKIDLSFMVINLGLIIRLNVMSFVGVIAAYWFNKK